MAKTVDLMSHFVKATEEAAIAAAKWRGRGDGKLADGAAVEAMRAVFDTVPFDGRVAIGEGERDDAPMLWIGEPLGSMQGVDGALQIDIAVDPLECTNHVAKDLPNAIAVLAAAPRGTLLHAPDCYMDKLAGPAEVSGEVSLEADVAYNVEAAAAALDKSVNELRVVVMDRDRHRELIKTLRGLDVSVPLIGDGDVSAALDAATPHSDVDLLMGIGAAPEGVITATALRGLGAHFEGRLVTTNEDHERRAREMLGDDVDKLWGRDDLCASSDALFVASGVCSGYLPGVEDLGSKVAVHSEVIDVNSGTRQFISAEYLK
ncbi:MAG: class II fructose-bisphosphatase [Candidatus Thalassarchaeaceae archaeon]|jgi:fructose-1,6-bisphosphatase class II|nr:class II fructose-bisphosphatase [Candidatus Thalassarchaeaceae archaeon]|tara:strand:+ start:3847 stop:4800 length:954 start_codon:yes stop_codon:yes gene_type:complete